jgi:hypothetical protein
MTPPLRLTGRTPSATEGGTWSGPLDVTRSDPAIDHRARPPRSAHRPLGTVNIGTSSTSRRIGASGESARCGSSSAGRRPLGATVRQDACWNIQSTSVAARPGAYPGRPQGARVVTRGADLQYTIFEIGSSRMSDAPCALRSGINVFTAPFSTTVSIA